MPTKKKSDTNKQEDKLKDMEAYLNKVNDTLEDVIARLGCMEREHDDLSMMTAGIKNDMDKVKPRLGLPT